MKFKSQSRPLAYICPMRIQLLITFVFLTFRLCAGDEPKVMYSIYLIGDTGKDTIPSEVLFLLAFDALDKPNSSVVFLGDNVYPTGNSYKSGTKAKKAQRILQSQLELFSTYRGTLFLIPGNHDWAAGKRGGEKAVLRQKAIVDSFSRSSMLVTNTDSVYFPAPGLPGPFAFNVHPQIQLVLIDSQWWLHRGLFRKTHGAGGRSVRAEKAHFLITLDSLLAGAEKNGRMTLVAGHHPIFSNGKHSHRAEPIRFLLNYTPLAIFHLFGLDRLLVQDMYQPRNKRFRTQLRSVIAKHSGVVYASGHEHNLQVMKDRSNYFVVSGAGAKLSATDRYRYPAMFMEDRQQGFFRLDLMSNGEIQLKAFGVRDRGEYWQKTLFRFATPTAN